MLTWARIQSSEFIITFTVNKYLTLWCLFYRHKIIQLLSRNISNTGKKPKKFLSKWKFSFQMCWDSLQHNDKKFFRNESIRTPFVCVILENLKASKKYIYDTRGSLCRKKFHNNKLSWSGKFLCLFFILLHTWNLLCLSFAQCAQ